MYSTTLPAVSTERPRLVRSFDPAAISHIKSQADRDLGIGGAAFAAEAFRAGLIDEYQLFIAPAVIGGGKAALPADVRLDLELLDQRRFSSGTVHLRYRVMPSGTS